MARQKIIPIFIPQGGCGNRCIFCNQFGITGYPAMPKIEELESLMPSGGKDYELAYYGGTFTALPKDVMLGYLNFAKKMREQNRIGTLRISTHPAALDEEIIAILKEYGVDTIELGVQSFDDEVLEKAGRCHGKREVIYSMFLVKNNGFRLGIQLMTGLPLDTEEKVFAGIREILPYAPDMVRIYPLLVLENTPLSKSFEVGEYQPMSLDSAVALVAKMYSIFCYYHIPVIRMGLQPTEDLNLDSNLLIAGPFHPSFGHLVKSALKKKQMEMLLKDGPKRVRILGPKEDLPLLFGDKGNNIKELGVEKEIAVSGMHCQRGTIAMASYNKREKDNILATLTEQEFLEKYMNEIGFWR